METRHSSAFDLLQPKVQNWIWKEKWSGLHEIQEEAIPLVLGGRHDVLIGAPTAGGKTEAAFLPIASALEASEVPEEPGLCALYVSPLKALINDQARRLEGLFGAIDVSVHRWHGDIDAGRKRKILSKPSGVLLITPESLEALFILRGAKIPWLFRRLRYVVIDELHAFPGTERGRQLQSLLHRVEDSASHRVPRIALSATLGEMGLASEFLRPGEGADVRRIVCSSGGQEVRVQVRTYRPTGRLETEEAPSDETAKRGEAEEAEEEASGFLASDLFHLYRAGHHLVFANRRAEVEIYSDRLRTLSEMKRAPDVFWPHHGSLSKGLREEAEKALRREERSATVLATTTLELGIDVGRVESVGQIGPPSSVAALRQRLGRSGRRGEPARLRIFIQERRVRPDSPPHERLHVDLVHSIATVRLLAKQWCEPPSSGALHLSTLVQQILSVIAERGGIFAEDAYRHLCTQGPFRAVDPSRFTRLLRDLGNHELISQLHTGEITLGLAGERLVNQFDFYAAFSSSEEYRVVAREKTLGTLPVIYPLIPDTYLIFGGRRWRIDDVDDQRKVVYLSPAPGGRAPIFAGSGALIHDRIREEMRSIYESSDSPSFADRASMETLGEARASYRDVSLSKRSVLAWNGGTLIFPWRGDRVMNTILCLLRARDLRVGLEGIVIHVRDLSPNEARDQIETLLEEGLPDPLSLAADVPNKSTEKHHRFLSEPLLAADYASDRLDLEGTESALRRIVVR